MVLIGPYINIPMSKTAFILVWVARIMMEVLLLDRTGHYLTESFSPNLQHRWHTRGIHVSYILFFQFPNGFGVLLIQSFLYKVFGSTILSFFKRMLFYTQSSCEIFEKGYKLGEFFDQLLSLRAFITGFNVSSIWVSLVISSISIDWDFASMMKFIYLSVTLRDFSISLRIENLERASAGFSVPLLHFISKSNYCERKIHLSIPVEGFNVRE